MNKEIIIEEIKELLKGALSDNNFKAINEKLSFWKNVLEEMEEEKTSVDRDRYESAKKTEEYAWGALYSLLAQQSNQVEDTAWDILEKALKIIRRLIIASL